MSTSSYIGNRSRGGTGLLPTTIATASSPAATSKTRQGKKGRRRALLRDFILGHIMCIGLCISIILLIGALIRLGRFPRPPTHFKSRVLRPRNVVSGKIFNQGSESTVALVDIITKDLYDKIEFLDVDGGPWKQGWEVSYIGDEWNHEKLKVFVVPHSHNDPGWKLTVDEYYERQSRHILDTIVETLSKDARRKFIWEEMSYLQRWWMDAPDVKKEALKKLLQNGQLEIVGGGWVMNDEANSHYYAIIEQMIEGNMWLNETTGIIPRNAWAIDPFGYSPTMAYLLRRMGFKNMLIQRTHYELKKELAMHKNLEFTWRQSWDAEETTDILVHMMPFYSYDVPHTCGPEPAICCQFDFARMRQFSYELCPWGQHPMETTQENVQERAEKLLDQYRKKSTLYRTNTLLVPLGDDFRYINSEEAEAQFRNYQMLFDYINANPGLNAEAKFGTLEDYFQTLREEAARVNYSRPGEVGSAEVDGFPSLSGDFFTYADRQQDYWSGYYVSRPFFKAIDRVLEQTLRASEMLMALLLGHCHHIQCEKLPTSFGLKLTAARRNLALFQHHDGVTGTAKDHVVRDYGLRMHTSLQDLQIFMSKAIEILLGGHFEKPEQIISQYEPEHMRSTYDAQPIHRKIIAEEKSASSVVVFNPLEQTRNEVLMVIVDSPDVSVLDSNWVCIESQVSPQLQHSEGEPFADGHRLHWRASVPPLGLQTYYIAKGLVGCEKAVPAKLKIFTESNQLTCPGAPYSCSRGEGDVTEIQNQKQKVTFDLKNGLLVKATYNDGSHVFLGEELDAYASTGGAYLFKPVGDAKPVIKGGGVMVQTMGPIMQEFYTFPKTEWLQSPVSHSTRVYHIEGTIQEFIIEKEYHVELTGPQYDDREIIARYKTDMDNRRVFYSDLNGFQMSRRETYDKIPVQGNYYPMPSLAFIQGRNGQRFSVHSRQALGVASLNNGWLEIMLDRRLRKDDGRGLGQGVRDNRPLNIIFHLLVETNVSSTKSPTSNPYPLKPSILSHLVGAQLNYPQHIFIAKAAFEVSARPPVRSFAPLSSSLPCNMYIVSLKVPRPLKYSQQSAEEPRFAITLQRRGWDTSYCKKGQLQCPLFPDEPVNLFRLFKDLEVMHARPVSLNFLTEDTEMLGYSEQPGELSRDGHVLISPMEIQAYKFELRHRQ